MRENRRYGIAKLSTRSVRFFVLIIDVVLMRDFSKGEKQ